MRFTRRCPQPPCEAPGCAWACFGRMSSSSRGSRSSRRLAMHRFGWDLEILAGPSPGSELPTQPVAGQLPACLGGPGQTYRARTGTVGQLTPPPPGSAGTFLGHGARPLGRCCAALKHPPGSDRPPPRRPWPWTVRSESATTFSTSVASPLLSLTAVHRRTRRAHADVAQAGKAKRPLPCKPQQPWRRRTPESVSR